ncbi:hypothetical protein BOTCAL_0126g00110 [Botryotinia calthae]|uniref:Heterokaryon incompatibility domain-containing protein n=1 Tax=Botryotinia calthae TaxID=38488 RepID=A0A4Y8D477_9HELO|nr:hypothetical protein BOTCAL_0126g00110 [Botryotinia calthae]
MLIKFGIYSGYYPAINVREELRLFVNSQGVKSSFMMRCIRLLQKGSSNSTLPQSTEPQHSSPRSFNTEMILLSSALEHDATVPHDKIFSIYPLLQFCGMDLPQINYDQPFEMLCEKVTRCWFDSTRNLNIILLATRLPSNDSCMPSWVPDWRNRQSALEYRLKVDKTDVGNSRGVPRKNDRASNGSSLDESPKTITGELHLRGLSLGTISRVLFCDVPDDVSARAWNHGTLGVFRTWCCAVNDSSFYSTRQESQDALLLTMCAYFDYDWKKPMFRVVFGLLYDLMFYPDCRLLDSAQAKKAYEKILEVERVSGRLHFEAYEELVTFLSTFWIENRSPDLGHLSDLHSEFSMGRVFKHIYSSLTALAYRIKRLRNHSLLITDSCYGLAPSTAREGDEVYLLKGLDIPVVLRPSGENYSFVGPCSYIHGVMEGQKWPEDESELQDIVLV